MEWEWYTDTNVFRVFVHCLLKANHVAKQWRGKTINEGEFITSYGNLAQELSGRYHKLSIQQVRTALQKLTITGELTIKTTNKFTLIKLNNWTDYKTNNTQHNRKITGKQQSNNNQITTTKNDKNEKNEKKGLTPPTLVDVYQYVVERNLDVDASDFFHYYDAIGWVVGKARTPMKKWKSAVARWKTRFEYKPMVHEPVKTWTEAYLPPNKKDWLEFEHRFIKEIDVVRFYTDLCQYLYNEDLPPTPYVEALLKNKSFVKYLAEHPYVGDSA